MTRYTVAIKKCRALLIIKGKPPNQIREISTYDFCDQRSIHHSLYLGTFVHCVPTPRLMPLFSSCKNFYLSQDQLTANSRMALLIALRSSAVSGLGTHYILFSGSNSSVKVLSVILTFSYLTNEVDLYISVQGMLHCKT